MIVFHNNGRWEILQFLQLQDNKSSINHDVEGRSTTIFNYGYNNEGIVGFWFVCPGCSQGKKRPLWHTVNLFDQDKPVWTIHDKTGNLVTKENIESVDLNWLKISPSIGVRFSNNTPFFCHSFVEGDVINFCNDCQHSMNGMQGVKLYSESDFFKEKNNGSIG